MDNLDAREVWRTVANEASVRPYAGKRVLDIVGALIMCSLFAPVAVFAAAQICWQSGFPVMFRHRRVGLRGRYLDVYKFRSMVQGADVLLQELLQNSPEAAQEWAETRKLKNDPRVTGIGRFLRKTSLDELPQILNVLKGEMSLVGPRPVIAEELEEYGPYLSYYLATKPGLTGLWQVSGRNDVSYEKRVGFDVHYARNQSLLMDVGILLKTVKVLFGDQTGY